MRRIPAATVLALMLATTACGGDEPKADPTPSPSASESETPTPSPTPTPTPSPSVPAQTPGKYGVTVTFVDWDRWGADPVVQAWDRFGEVLGGSINSKRLAPELKDEATGKAYDDSLQAYQLATTKDWHSPKVTIARIVRVRHQGPAAATLTGCIWDPSQEYRDRNGKIVDPVNFKKAWLRIEVPYKKAGGRWKATDQRLTGECQAPPPRG